MALIARPFDDPANSISEAQWWQMASLWAPDGVVPGAGGGPGVGELEAYATGSEYAVRVRPGNAYIQGIYCTSSTEVTLVPGAPPSGAGSVRTDYVVLRVLWGGGGVPLHAEFGLITNLPGLATPGNVYEHVLAAVTIPNGAGTLGPGAVVPLRTWTGPQSSIPVGTIVGYPVATPPPGWLVCDGRAVSRVEYSRLFAVLGTAYGADDAASFRLPDLRGRGLVGLDNLGVGGAGVLPAAAGLNASGGAAQGTLTLAQLPSHTHGVTLDLDTQADSPPHGHTAGIGDVVTDTVGGSHTHDVTATGTTDPATAHRHALAASGTSVNVSAGVFSVPSAAGGYTGYEEPPGHSHTATLSGSTTGATGGHAHTVPLGTLTTSGITANHTHHLAATLVTGGAGAAAPAAFDLTQPWLAGAYIIKT